MDFQNNNNQEFFDIFQTESEDIMSRVFDNLNAIENNLGSKEILNDLYRNLHSIKGAVRMVGFGNIQDIIHKIEDIIDIAKSSDGKILDKDKVTLIIKSMEKVYGYIQESIINKREIIDKDFSPTLSGIEACILELSSENINEPPEILGDLFNYAEGINTDSDFTSKEEDLQCSDNIDLPIENINISFNACFQIIDGILPEQESQDTVILKEEVQKLYEYFKDSDLYEVKTSLQNVITKLEVVMAGTNTFTISEILEMRNDLSSAAGKFNTSCIKFESGEKTFFDVAEKISMLQSSCVYAEEIKSDIVTLKASSANTEIDEIISIIIEILDFITENSVQLEEQMAQTLKSGVEYCASPNENVDGDLIVQQLEIMKQLLELSFKKDTGLSESKTMTAQTAVAGNNNTEIKTMHVNAQKLDSLVNQLGELIITKIKTEKSLDKIDVVKNGNENCLKDLLKTLNYLRYYNRKYLQQTKNDQYLSAFVKQVFMVMSDMAQNLSRTIYDLNSLYRTSKEDSMKMRLIIDEMESMVKNIRVLPISTVFNSYTRMVRDIAAEKGKDIDFEIQGNDTCADKKIIEEIKSPLIHILRNAIDHGIESKEERLMAGKSPVGKIVLSAKQDDNKVIIDVVDDGQGFNIEKIKSRAVSRGFLTQEEVDSMNDESIMNIIFWPGFTTGDSITSISGRGIGLDVVKTKISQLNGKVNVLSEYGKGSCVHIEIPVTLTTLRVFLVKVAEQIFAIPIQVISTFILKNKDEIKTNNGVRTILFNNEIISLYYLSDILGFESAPANDKETILIIESDGKTIGLAVDRLLGDQDILQKKLSAPLYKVKNISGITNLASGELCLVLNMQDIMRYDFNKISTIVSTKSYSLKEISMYKRILVIDDSMTTRAMIKNILTNVGYGVDAVSDATEALVKLKLNHYDLIITDLLMEKIDGYELIERLQCDEMYMDIPIIVISSSLTSKENIEKINKYNIDGYVKKDTFKQDEFIAKINEVIAKHHV